MQITAKFIFQLPSPIVMRREYGSRPYQITDELVVYAPAALGPPKSKEPQWQPKSEQIIGGINGEPIWEARYIIIDIKRDFPSIPITDEDQKALVARAREILYKILTLYRWRERQLQIDAKNIEGVDYRLHYFDANNNPIDAGPSNAQKTGEVHLTARLIAHKVNKWNDICQHLASGTMPEIYESLILDAYSVVKQEPRRAVLDAATAREVYLERFYKSNSKRRSALEALQQKKPELMKELNCLQDTNTFVKHEGLCGYKDEKGQFIEVDSKRAKEFIKAVEDAIEYTKALAC